MKRHKWFILIGLLVLTLISFYFDEAIVRGVSLIRGEILNEFFMGLTFVSSEVIFFFIITSLFLWKEHKRKWIIPIWFTLFLSAVLSFILKYSIQRLRPYQLGIVSTFDVLEKANHLVWNYSFPSFQAMLVFCAVPILSKEFPKLKYFWFIFAGLVAFSRVYFGVHFLSDVMVGGIMGYLIGILVIDLEKKTKFFEKIYCKIF